MYFRSLREESTGEISYLLADVAHREAVLIDPRAKDIPLISALLFEYQLALRWVLRTHHHDNGRVNEWNALTALQAPIVQGDPFGGAYSARDGQQFGFGKECVTAFSTPGHTAYCLSFQWRDRLYCGGLLDVTQCPHQPFALKPEQLWDTGQNLLRLPGETLLFSGHAQDAASVTSLLDQRRFSPYFSNLSRDDFLKRLAALPGYALPAPSTTPILQ